MWSPLPFPFPFRHRLFQVRCDGSSLPTSPNSPTDDNGQIIVDDEIYQKRFEVDTITAKVTRKLGDDYLEHLQGKADLNDYKKPR